MEKDSRRSVASFAARFSPATDSFASLLLAFDREPIGFATVGPAIAADRFSVAGSALVVVVAAAAGFAVDSVATAAAAAVAAVVAVAGFAVDSVAFAALASAAVASFCVPDPPVLEALDRSGISPIPHRVPPPPHLPGRRYTSVRYRLRSPRLSWLAAKVRMR